MMKQRNMKMLLALALALVLALQWVPALAGGKVSLEVEDVENLQVGSMWNSKVEPGSVDVWYDSVEDVWRVEIYTEEKGWIPYLNPETDAPYTVEEAEAKDLIHYSSKPYNSGWHVDYDGEGNGYRGIFTIAVTAGDVSSEKNGNLALYVDKRAIDQDLKADVAVGNVTATVHNEEDSEDPYENRAYVRGIQARGSADGENIGEVTIQAKDVEATATSDNAWAEARGIQVSGDDDNGTLSLAADSVTATANGVAVQGWQSTQAQGVEVWVWNEENKSEYDLTIAGDVTAAATLDKEKSDEDWWVDSVGLIAEAVGSNANIVADVGGKVSSSATYEAEGSYAYAAGIVGQANEGAVSVTAGGASASATAESGVAYAIEAFSNGKGKVDITVDGDATATFSGTTGKAYGIYAETDEDSEGTVNVTVDGDVTAKGGKESDGIYVENYGKGEVNIVVNGTVSGDTNAIKLFGTRTEGDGEVSYKGNNDKVSLTVWSVKEGKNGNLVSVYDEGWDEGDMVREVNAEASKKVEAAINYIVRVNDAARIKAAGEKGKTVTIGDTTYATANEGENVNVTVTLKDTETLEGIYYNADDESTLMKVETLKQNDKGDYVVKMLRGGAMNLGLKVSTTETPAEEKAEEPAKEETKYPTHPHVKPNAKSAASSKSQDKAGIDTKSQAKVEATVKSQDKAEAAAKTKETNKIVFKAQPETQKQSKAQSETQNQAKAQDDESGNTVKANEKKESVILTKPQVEQELVIKPVSPVKAK